MDFTFPAMSLAAGAAPSWPPIVAAFQSRYGNAINVAGFFAGDLGNGGEDIVLQLPDPYDAGILRFDYNDTWYPNTDGAGYALVVNNTSTAARDWDQKTTWRSSGTIFGSPGRSIRLRHRVNGQIFNDTNANGIQNAGETGRAALRSRSIRRRRWHLRRRWRHPDRHRDTGATGDYSFTGPAPGAYYLSRCSAGWSRLQPVDQGGNDATDSDFDPITRRTAVFTLAAGQNDTSRDGLLSSRGPSVDIVDVTPDRAIVSVSSISIVFDQPVTGFDLADLALTRDGGANLLTGAQTLTSTDNHLDARQSRRPDHRRRRMLTLAGWFRNHACRERDLACFRSIRQLHGAERDHRWPAGLLQQLEVRRQRRHGQCQRRRGDDLAHEGLDAGLVDLCGAHLDAPPALTADPPMRTRGSQGKIRA